MKKINIVITGAGGVGKLLAETLAMKRQIYAEEFNAEVKIIAMCNSRAGFVPGHGSAEDWQPGLTGKKFIDAVFGSKSSQETVLFEASPSNYITGEPALSYTKRALAAGADVITVSKGALVKSGASLQNLANTSRAHLLASAAGSAGLPLIDLLKSKVFGARPRRIEAVLTGTTAFMLDKMLKDGGSYEDALAEAQSLGIAERDPSFDFDGFDTAAKLTIILGMAYGVWIDFEKISRQSLQSVTAEHLFKWRKNNLRPALVGVIDFDAVDHDTAAPKVSVELRDFEVDHAYHSAPPAVKSAFLDTELGSYAVIGGASDLSVTVAAALKDFETLLEEDNLT